MNTDWPDSEQPHMDQDDKDLLARRMKRTARALGNYDVDQVVAKVRAAR